MVSPSDITNFAGAGWWSGFSVIGTWIGYVLLAGLLMAVFFGLFTMLQYKIKVTYFPIRGDVEAFKKDPSSSNVTLGKPKNDRARRIKKKGVEYFRLLLARKSIKDVPYKLEYPDGVWLIRKSRDEFISIARPDIGNPSIVVNTMDQGLQLWDQLRGQEVMRRFTDEDLARKQLYIFAGVVIATLIFVGIVIYLSYATSNAAIQNSDKVAGALNALGEKIGIAGPG